MRDIERSLLSEKKKVACPACRLEEIKVKANGVPKKELFFLSLVILSSALPISSLFPYIYFLVQDFEIAKSDKDIGFYAGFIGSAYMVGRFLTSAFWGYIADKFGRKPVFYIGTLSIIIFMTLFGFSTNYWMALITRFLLGSFNGMLGPVRAYASELCDDEHQALGLSMVGTMWGLGLVLGPALGGYLAQPSIQYPSVFPEGSFFDQFQYLLPSLCISIFSLATLPFVIMLPESLHKHTPKENKEDAAESAGEKNHIEEVKENSKLVQGHDREDFKKENSTKKDSIWKNRNLAASITVYCLWALHDMSYSEIFSLWAVSPSEYGGLGFSTSGVGNVLSISGAAMLVFQLFLFPPLARFFGPIMMARAPAIATAPLVALYPLIASLKGISLWITIISASVMKNVLSMFTITGSFLMINNSVTMEQRGLANGISMTGMSLFKAIGPACAGSLFSWAQNRLDASFLPGNWMIFFILDFVCIMVIIATFEPFLPRSVNKPKPGFEIDVVEEDQNLKRAASFNI